MNPSLAAGSLLVIRFLISGGTATAVNVGTLYVLTEFAGLWYILSSVVAFVLAFCVSFTMQKWWTFAERSTHRVGSQAGLYFAVALGNLGLNTLLLYVLVEWFGLWYVIAQLIASAIIAAESFLLYRFVIFGPVHEPPSTKLTSETRSIQ